MVASTLSADPMEEVAARLGDTPSFFQLYTPTDRELAESLVRRAEEAGFNGIVVTLDTWVTGWRPRDLATSNFPQLRGFCLANYTSDPVFRARLAQSPEENPMAAAAPSTRAPTASTSRTTAAARPTADCPPCTASPESSRRRPVGPSCSPRASARARTSLRPWRSARRPSASAVPTPTGSP
jgi:hypothetical protein